VELNIDLDSSGPVTAEAGRQIVLTIQAYADTLLATTRRITLSNGCDISTAASVLGARESMSLVKRTRDLVDQIHQAMAILNKLQDQKQISSGELKHLQEQIKVAEERAEEAAQRAELNERQAQAVDAKIERSIGKAVTNLERSARKREWGIGTIVALAIGLVVGVGSILLAHVIFGF
jgi:biopolymer transport protein ExbB/TolQ